MLQGQGRLLLCVLFVLSTAAVPAVSQNRGRETRGNVPRNAQQGPRQDRNQPRRQAPTPRANPRPANGPNGAALRRRPLPPSFYPLPATEQAYVDQLLSFWEKKSNQIKRYSCRFIRWEYDPVYGPAMDPKTKTMDAKTISHGEIRYSTPNRGMFRVTKMTHYRPPKRPGDKPKYVKQPGDVFEHWVCNGKSVYQLHAATKQLREFHLPPDMQGRQIFEGPLPFLFAANVKEIKQRYWLHVITSKDAAKKGEYWMEAFPKRQEEASQFKMLHVIFDKQFLPRAIRVFATNYHPVQNPRYETLVFEKRDWNFKDLLNSHEKSFRAPGLPTGWTRVPVESYGGVTAANPKRVGNPRQAARPRGRVNQPPRQQTQPARRR